MSDIHRQRIIRLERDWLLEPTKFPGKARIITCYVGWPELQLNEEQVLENAIARMDNKPEPYYPSGLILVEVV